MKLATFTTKEEKEIKVRNIQEKELAKEKKRQPLFYAVLIGFRLRQPECLYNDVA